jgi:hypothetical protein
VTRLDGIPPKAQVPPRRWSDAAARLKPWKRRIVGLLAAWVVIAGVTVAFGTAPNVPVLLAVLVALAALLWHVVDHAEAHHLTVWPLVDGEITGQGRGNDFRVTNLAGRLTAANVSKEGREALVRDLHVQLQVLIRERLYAKHGLVAEEEPRWAEAVTPPELWQLLVGLPPPDLYRPDRLDPLLTRIEKW